MIKVIVNEKGGGERVLTFEKDVITMGRSQRNDVILPRSNVSKKHATVTSQGSSLIIRDENSTNGTFVNGRRLSAPAAVGPEDKVFVSDFILILEAHPSTGMDLDATFPPPLPNPPVEERLDEQDVRAIEPVTAPPGEPEPIEEIEPEEEEEEEEIEPIVEDTPVPEEPPGPPVLEPVEARGERSPLVREVEGEVLGQLDSLLDLDRIEAQVYRDQDFRNKMTRTIAEILDAMVDAGQIPPDLEPSQITERITSEVLRLGPLDDLLEDQSVTEIIVPARGDICVHTPDGVRRIADPFVSTKSRQLVIRKLRAILREGHGESTAALSGALDGGEEVFMLLPPVVMEGVAVVIRKPPVTSEGGMDALVARGILSQGMARFLGYCIEARQGVLVCDPGLGSHRTLIPAMVSMLEPWERLVALQCGRTPLYDIETQVYAVLPGEGEGGLGIDVAASDLVQVVGAFRPTALIAGDIKSIDHFRLIRQAGSSRAFTISTIDAESEMDGLARMGGWLAREHSIIPRAVATGILLDAIDIVVFHSRMMDGSEKITRISELVPGKEGLPTLKPIFRYEVKAVSAEGLLEGTFKATRHAPSFMDSRRGRGSRGKFDQGIFQ